MMKEHIKMRFILALCLTLLFNSPLHAYSYSAAGNEPLIDARGAIVHALEEGDFKKAENAFKAAHDDIEFLATKYDPTLLDDFKAALKNKDEAATFKSIHRLFAAEIERRLKSVVRHIDNYQLSKVAVIKSFRFFDVIAPEFEETQRKAIRAALQDCLNAIGKPGVFGSGAVVADPVAYEAAWKSVVQAFVE
jgi:hypothetical protein